MVFQLSTDPNKKNVPEIKILVEVADGNEKYFSVVTSAKTSVEMNVL